MSTREAAFSLRNAVFAARHSSTVPGAAVEADRGNAILTQPYYVSGLTPTRAPTARTLPTEIHQGLVPRQPDVPPDL